eukprot:2170638-Alexandrium_andersonii.AAC.1
MGARSSSRWRARLSHAGGTESMLQGWGGGWPASWAPPGGRAPVPWSSAGQVPAGAASCSRPASPRPAPG